MTPGIEPTAERRHVPGAGSWEERWWFDVAAADGSYGAYARLAFRPADGVAWYWAALVGGGRPLVALRAHDLRIPARGTEVRGDGVWAVFTCEDPLGHWSLGLECFAAAYEDPFEAWGQERGDVVPFGFDLEWEAAAPARPCPGGYAQWCGVHGEILVGDERLEVAAGGWREHAWGADEGPGWRVAGPGLLASGSGGGAAGRAGALVTERDAAGVPVGAVLDGHPLVPTHYSPVAVPGHPVLHALCGATWVTWR